MFNKLFVFLNSRMGIRVLVPVSLIVSLVIFSSLWYNISFQNKLGIDLMTSQNAILMQAIEGEMFDALAIGNNEMVRTQFKRLSEKIKDLKVFVYDSKGIVSFSTDSHAVGKPMENYIGSNLDLGPMLETGNVFDNSSHLTLDGVDFAMKSNAFLNEARCFQCHQQEAKVLGGISVLSSMTLMKKSIQKGKNTNLLIGVAGFFIILMSVWMFFYFLVNKKIVRVMDAISLMRKKDFTQELQVGMGDEINYILARINLVTLEFRLTIQQIVENSGTIFSSASQLSHIADNLNISSRDASEMTTSVAAAAEEMSTGNHSIAAAMEDATQALTSIAASVDEMSATVGEIARNSAESKGIIEQVVAAFETILSDVEKLGIRANDVDEVTDEIRSISEQVSMLALNAKIEAARAGEAGKGFAVVAQEITQLAAETSQSTLEADKKLRWIKATSKQLTEKVSGLSGIVKNSDDAISSIAASVEEQNVTTMEIAKNINDVSEKIALVNQSVSQGAQVATEIARDITQVQDVSAKVQENSKDLNDNASALIQMAEKFTALMKQFKV
jgi:methyl-accepting chemotaxis protein